MTSNFKLPLLDLIPHVGPGKEEGTKGAKVVGYQGLVIEEESGRMEEGVLSQISAFFPCIPKPTASVPPGGTLHKETKVVFSGP